MRPSKVRLADHIEGNIGIAVVDPFPTGVSGDDGKHNHAEAVDKARLEQGTA